MKRNQPVFWTQLGISLVIVTRTSGSVMNEVVVSG